MVARAQKLVINKCKKKRGAFRRPRVVILAEVAIALSVTPIIVEAESVIV